MLIPGAKYPQDILEAQGPEAVEEYIIAEIQNAYRTQGVDINDKHIEVIVRQMMRKLRITDPGSTDLLQNVSYEYKEIAEANAAVQAPYRRGRGGGFQRLPIAQRCSVLQRHLLLPNRSYRQLPSRRPHACLPKPPSRARLTRCSVLRKCYYR